LVKRNGVNESQIKQAWEKIYDEYLTIIKDREQSYIMNLSREINLLEFKVNIINYCVNILDIQNSLGDETDEEIVNVIRQFVPVFGEFNDTDRIEYVKKLQQIINNSKRFIIELKNKEIEFDKLMPKTKQSIKREYFDRLISQVSKYVKYQISKYTISVTEFANLVADLRTYNEYLQQEYGK
jgi:recombinational DNA repair ATPase RecF